MNEILRAKRLTEEILARAAAIKNHMADVDARMANMQQIEERSRAKAAGGGQLAVLPSVPQTLHLMELPDDLLGQVAKSLRSYDALIALSRVSVGRYCTIVWGDTV